MLLGVLMAAGTADSSNYVARMAGGHTSHIGVRWPTPEFAEALTAGAVDVSKVPGSRSSSLVILAMANGAALNLTVPIFLESLRRITTVSGKTLDHHVAIVVWSRQDLATCRNMAEYHHQCVRDPEHKNAEGVFGFHSVGFHSLGFAKVKYIVNAVSLGIDTVFLDTDIVVLQDPIPHMAGQPADLLGSMEKCIVVNTTYDYQNLAAKEIPPFNIGVLYFRATAGVARCVDNWWWDMFNEVQGRPKVWDQELYGKILSKCNQYHDVSWRALDPRRFQSACFPQCGCAFDDDEVDGRQTMPARGIPYLDAAPAAAAAPAGGGRDGGAAAASAGRRALADGSGAAAASGGRSVKRATSKGKPAKTEPQKFLCGPSTWERFVLMHFPCSGVVQDKRALMVNLLEGFTAGRPAVINPP